MAILYSGGMLDTVALCRHGGARPPPPGFLTWRFQSLPLSVRSRLYLGLPATLVRVLSLRPPSSSDATSCALLPPWQNRRLR